eukprot:2237041-Rhodomonas_salina.1
MSRLEHHRFQARPALVCRLKLQHFQNISSTVCPGDLASCFPESMFAMPAQCGVLGAGADGTD